MTKPDEPAKSPRLFLFASIGIVLAALYFAQDVLIPLALAVLFSFLLAPVVSWLEKLRFPRSAAVIVTVVLAFSVLFGIGYVVYSQLGDLKADLAGYQKNIHAKIDGLRGPLAWMRTAGTEVKQALAPTTAPTKSSQQIEPTPVRVVNAESTNTQGSPLDLVRSVGSFVLGPIGTAFIVIVFSIFIQSLGGYFF